LVPDSMLTRSNLAIPGAVRRMAVNDAVRIYQDAGSNPAISTQRKESP